MKHQYFGDENDYRKYGLLRALSNKGEIRTMVCWMLTNNGSENDGMKTAYLHRPEQCRQYDPEVFDFLYQCVHVRKSRSVHHIEESTLLSATDFFLEDITDSAEARERYFSAFFQKTVDADFLFFDPDNGIEVRSRPYGKKDSSKYVYWSELQTAYERGHSLLIYQHFPRVNRKVYLQSMAQTIQSVLATRIVISLATSMVAYLLIPQPSRERYFCERISALQQQWGDQFRVTEHHTAKKQ